VAGLKGYILSLVNPKFVSTGLKTAVFVGSLLFFVNHGLAFVQGEMTSDRWISVILTYIMPYLVNVHGQYSSQRKWIANKS
jgi:hypothetical protein